MMLKCHLMTHLLCKLDKKLLSYSYSKIFHNTLVQGFKKWLFVPFKVDKKKIAEHTLIGFNHNICKINKIILQYG